LRILTLFVDQDLLKIGIPVKIQIHLCIQISAKINRKIKSKKLKPLNIDKIVEISNILAII